MKKLKLLCLAALLIVLTSCGVISQTPPNQAIRLAVSQMLANTQETLAQELGLANGMKNKRGTFRTELRTGASSNSIGQSSPFEIYLGTNPQETDSDVETWFLIKSSSS